MGRLLDIARRTPVCATPDPLAAPRPEPAPIPPRPEPEPPLDRPASDVLAALVHADHPLTHTALLQALAERGHSKETARQAIARCQHWRWIEHNLTTGYVLA